MDMLLGYRHQPNEIYLNNSTENIVPVLAKYLVQNNGHINSSNVFCEARKILREVFNTNPNNAEEFKKMILAMKIVAPYFFRIHQ